MKTDFEIQQDVMDQLRWNPFLNASEIGVAVKNGIVTLSGMVDTYTHKIEAERSAKKVFGVRGIAEDIQIGVSPSSSKTDAEIAASVVNALKWHTTVPENKIKVKVENGIVTLEGDVEWEFQRNSAKKAVCNLLGVRDVLNLVRVKPRISVADVKNKISAAFHRSATIDADKISVEVSGDKVILKGEVRSYAEKEDAEDAAWSAPGIASVDSRLVLIPEELYTF
jgi:osmotically-inducible protein OsmY